MSRRLPRKVLHVLNGAGGGAALTTRALVAGLRQHGIESCAVCHAMGSPDEWRALEESFSGELERVDLYWWNRKVRSATWKRPLIEVRQWVRTGATLGSTGKVAQVARRFGADLIHTNTLLTPEGARAARLLHLPHVWHVRELIGDDQPFQLPLANARLGQFLRSHASLVLANSEASAAALRPVLPATMLRVVPNGIDLARFSDVKPSGHAVPVVAMVANLSSRTKRHALFIEAMARLGNRASARLYGGGTDLTGDAYVEDLKAKARAAGVELRGFVAPEQIMNEIDVLVQPAENESFGRTVLEAMASGLAVAGADAGGVGELLEHEVDGLEFSAGSVEGLAEVVGRLCGDASLRARLGAAARQKARRRYSVGAMTLAVVEAYEEAMRFPLHTPFEGLAVAVGLA